ncbi:acyl-CoA dehydrogenase family protein [Agrobacterium vitis]|uniref:Acyl-CoA dehydrogenase n=1 Tax=Agrobacterium vitis TaxID=373 RepID=A0ABW9TFS2_AGRVI|nr:acyl-CoA dehydrogenase family protein [Agrobacterium vitis]MUO43027.1 hypothetical protein [Agrobacterium vitis]
MHLPLTPGQRAASETAGRLARERFAPRAAAYDTELRLPVEDLRDLAEAGLLNLAAGEDIGGGGSGVLGKDPLLYLLILEQLARYSGLATSHSLQVHSHAVHFIDRIADDRQRRTVLAPLLQRNVLMTTLGSEPGRTARGARHTTLARRSETGFVLSGVKNFATLADACGYLLVLADGDPQSGVAAGQRLGLLVPVDGEGVRIEPGSWDPYGMRAAVSPVVHLEEHFVPQSHVIGAPGAHAAGNWSLKADLGFAAQYVGGAQRILDLTADAVQRRGLSESPPALVRLGEAQSRVESARWHYYGAAKLWELGDEEAAGPASLSAKLQAIHAGELALEMATRIAGPSAFQADSALSRISRDLRYFMMREQVDAGAISIGSRFFNENPIVAAVDRPPAANDYARAAR